MIEWVQGMKNFSVSRHLLLLDTDDLSASCKDGGTERQHPHCGTIFPSPVSLFIIVTLLGCLTFSCSVIKYKPL